MKAKEIAGLLVLCVQLPIWFYLLWYLLKAVNAGELAWFLYWVYLPVTCLTAVIGRLLAGKE